MTQDAAGYDFAEHKPQKQMFYKSAVRQGQNLQRVEDRATGGAFPHCCAQLPRHLISLPLPPSTESDLSASPKTKMNWDAHI